MIFHSRTIAYKLTYAGRGKKEANIKPNACNEWLITEMAMLNEVEANS